MITYDSDTSGVYDDMMRMTRPSHPCHCPASGWRRPARSGEQAGGGKGIPWLKVWTRWQLQFFATKWFLKPVFFQSHLNFWCPFPQIWDGNAIVPWWQKELHLKTFKPHCSFKSWCNQLLYLYHCRRTFRVWNAFGLNLKFLFVQSNLAAKHKTFRDHET